MLSGIHRFAFLSLTLQAQLTNVVRAIEDPNRTGTIAENEFVDPNLQNNTQTLFTADPNLIPAHVASRLNRIETKYGLPPGSIRVDTRSGVISSIFLADPIIPGNGTGNNLGDNSTRTRDEWSAMAVQAVRTWLTSNQGSLNISVSELFVSAETIREDQMVRTAVHGENADFIQISMPRNFNGISVAGSRATAAIKKGNLISIGLEGWSIIPSNFSVTPSLSVDDAKNALSIHANRSLTDSEVCDSELRILTLINGSNPLTNFGNGYTHALAWRLCPTFEGQNAENMEGLVDAQSGRIYSFVDTNDYFQAVGSVYPLSNDGIVPDGVQQDGWPMPFMNVGSEVTDTGGNYFNDECQAVTYEGRYVKIFDECGQASIIDNKGIDWGTHSGTDCATSGIGGKGNTHSSRTGFYHLNKMMEIARAQLPGNSWLDKQLFAFVNDNSDKCNAYWHNVERHIGFYRGISGVCANFGEIAAVWDHEWGHGMDFNDNAFGISRPTGEGIADIFAALRLGDSCNGRGSFPGRMCHGYGDPCTSCTGVRDIDYLKRMSGLPHTWTWGFTNCPSKHCLGAVYSEAIWSLYKRELQTDPYNYDDNTALEIVMRLTFIGSGNVMNWFSGWSPGVGLFGGCIPDSGYFSYLMADDDDGDINNGTPHMQAIFKAFNDQQIACDSPAVQDSGCLGTPTFAPLVTASGGDMEVTLTWTSVSGTTKYQIFRAEGLSGCQQGKVLLGETVSLAFTDVGLQNGREYYYVVIPKGPNESCFGPSSSCTSVIPISSATSSGTSTGSGIDGVKWYVNYEDERCQQNCESLGGDSCGGIAMPWDFLFDDVTTCCDVKLSYKAKDYCEQKSLGLPYEGTGKYYVDHKNGRCLLDCDEPCSAVGQCGGIIEDSWVSLYDTIDECCLITLPWIDIDLCKDNSIPLSTGTDKFYPDTTQGKCLQDCNPPAAGCVRVSALSTPLFDTTAECCETHLSWVDRLYCLTRSVNVFSFGWFVDHEKEICVEDCETGTGQFCSSFFDPSIKIHDTLKTCCEQELNWIDTNKCIVLSQFKTFFSRKFYVDSSNNRCAKDCEPCFPGCAGNPPDSALPIYDTAEECCQFSLPFVNQEKCVADTNELPVDNLGSRLWYVDWMEMKCVQDCNGAAPCGGLKDVWELTFPTAEQCCGTIPWVSPCP